MSANAHIYQGTWPVVINALIQRFLAKNMLKKSHYSVTWASQRQDVDELKFETRISKPTTQCRHIFSAIEEIKYYVYELKPSIREEILEILQRMPSNVQNNFIGNIQYVLLLLKGALSAVLIEYAQQQNSMNARTSNKELPTFMRGETPNVPSTGSNLLEEQGLES